MTVNFQNHIDESAIAIISMAGRFPGASNLDEFWQNLRDGVDSISRFSDEELLANGVDPVDLKNPNYVKAKPHLSEVESFDATLFDIDTPTALRMDPQSRLFLECAWEALEEAGYISETDNSSIGVYAGPSGIEYSLNNLYHLKNEPLTIFTASQHTFATRIAYQLNLTGPALTILTFCSTSLVSIHTACQSILNGECHMAIAGGANVAPQGTGYWCEEGSVESPDGYCRPFDAKSNGTVFGDGVGVVVLKQLKNAVEDRDNIHAVIKGSAINNDGRLKLSFSAPNSHQQANAIAMAQHIAGVNPETISYIEAHGTGTTLGDPIEITALTKAFALKTQKKNFCAIGSVKANIGHANSAAGVAGLIKTILAIKHRQIPPLIHFETPNPKIDFANSPFYINTKLSEWKTTNGTPRRAGVSSLGVGGTNAHVVLEEWEPVEQGNKGTLVQGRKQQLLLLSAKTSKALEAASINLANHLKQHLELNIADVTYTLSIGRRAFDYRRFAVVSDLEDAENTLFPLDIKRVFTNSGQVKTRSVVFMFSGQGSQYVNMAREIYETETTFRKQVEQCSTLLQPHLGLDLRDILYPSDEKTEAATEKLKQTAITQPALFVIEYALAQLWMFWGINPVGMIGHSIGEYVAATLAGVLSLEEALKLVAARGRLMQSLSSGAMLSVRLSVEDMQPLLTDELSFAAHNAPHLCVVSGTITAIEALVVQLEAQHIEYRRLHTSHAFHSSMMAPILVAFREQVTQVNLHPPQIPYISNLSGTWITATQTTDPEYWCQHLRQTVRFSEGLQTLMEDTEHAYLEIGPGRGLATLARQHNIPFVFNSLRPTTLQQEDVAFLLTALGQLWLAGVAIDWTRFYAQEQRQRLPLPTYAFDRQRYWIEPSVKEGMENNERKVLRKLDLAKWFYLPLWKPTVPLALQSTAKTLAISRWLIFVDSCGLGSQLVNKLEQRGQKVITVQIGAKFTQLGEYHYSINPQLSSDYEALFQELHNVNQLPQAIVHLWSVTAEGHNPLELELEEFDKAQTRGFYSLLFLAQALKQEFTEEFQLMVVSNQTQPVTGGEVLQPEKATLLGPVKVIEQEYSHIHCRGIDIVLPSLETNRGQELLDQLIAEFATRSSDRVVAYREQQRWVQTFEPIQIDQVEKVSHLRENGVYLITGGLGQIGLTLAEFLATTVHAKLILIGRSAFPARKMWDKWLNNHNEDDRVSIIIKKLQALETNGAEFFIAQADVANLAQMQTVITQIEEHFGQLHGVIHGAGLLEFTPLEQLNQTYCERQFQPKVHGTLVLKKVLQDKPLDFCLLMSSLSSVLGGLGYAAYSAANLFMDALVSQHNQNCPTTPWLTINWDVWQFGESEKIALAELAMYPKEGSKALQSILWAPLVNQLIVSTGDLQTRLAQWIKSDVDVDSEKISSQKIFSYHVRPNLSNTYVAPRSQTEQQLVEIWQSLLGIEEIGIYDDFFELGGDSLLGTQVISEVRKVNRIGLPIHILFEKPTISHVAKYIEKTQSTMQNLTMLSNEDKGRRIEEEI